MPHRQVRVESTGEFWKPIWNLLEGSFELLLVNAQHVKRVPGRKTDVQDAEWLADLLQHGLLKASFIPPVEQRDRRDLTRQRTQLVRDRASVLNRIQKVLEGANIKLSSVVSEINGVSSRAILAELVADHLNPAQLEGLVHGRLRDKLPELEQALTGRVRAHHRFLLAQHLAHLDSRSVDEQIAAYGREIERLTAPFDELVDLLDTIPGVARTTAELILAEVGADLSRFPTANHLASWAGLVPGNNESAGKRLSGTTRTRPVWGKCAPRQPMAAGRIDPSGPCRGAPEEQLSGRPLPHLHHRQVCVAWPAAGARSVRPWRSPIRFW